MKIRLQIMFLIFAINIATCSFQTQGTKGFKEEQMKFSRVKNAYKNKETEIIKMLKQKNIDNLTVNILINVFKKEKELEVWIKQPNDTQYIHLKTYSICASSGNLGPKTRKGDGQIPEGIYYINRYNPYSNYHLSLGINYPNTQDLFRSKGGNPGGDIFIHGSCVTIGCIPITDEIIEELYILAVESKNSGQNNVPVYIYPFRFTNNNLNYLTNSIHNNLWTELMAIYKYFEKHKNSPIIEESLKSGYKIMR